MEKSFSRDFDRGFATRKHPRYYKSHAMTPSNEDGASSNQGPSEKDSLVRSRIPVSEGLMEFNGT